MTTILPAERSPWDVIGSQIGGQISQNLPQAVQQGYQRGQGLSAITQLQNDLRDAKGDYSKIIPAFMKAYTLNPALERSGIAEKYLPLMQREAGTEEFPVGGGKPRGPTRPGEKPGEQVPVGVADLVPARETSIRNPQGLTDFQLPYGPEEFAGIRQKARQLGYTPELEERYVKDAQQYNEVAQQKRNVEISNYQQQQQQREDTIKNQAAFANYMENNAKELWINPDDRELALKASERILSDPNNKNTSQADLLSKVKQEIRPYQSAVKALEKTLVRPLFGYTKNQQELARNNAQYMVENGQKPKLQLMIAKGGHGDVEEANLLNPLPETFEKNLDKFNRFIQPLDMVSNIDPDSPEYQKQLDRGIEKQNSQKQHMVDFLADHITTGTYNDPGTNLLLTRYHLIEKGLGWDEAGLVIQQAVKKGNIKLDPQQQIDNMKLGVPPLTGEGYSDTVLNNIMFPITGRE